MRSKYLIPLASALFLTSFAVAQNEVVAPVDSVSSTENTVPVDSVAPTENAVPAAEPVEQVASADSTVAKDSLANENVAIVDSIATVDSVARADSIAADSVARAIALEIARQKADSIARADSIAYADSVATANAAKIAKGFAIQGEVSGFLTAENSPYLVTGTLVVSEGKAWVIDAGVVLYFMPGTGIDIRGGAFAVTGSENKPVQFASAVQGEAWNGISFTGHERANLNYVQIRDAEIGIAVENAGADLEFVGFENVGTGVYARSSDVNLQNVSVAKSSGAAVVASKYGIVSIENSSFKENNVGVAALAASSVSLSNVNLAKNEYGFLNMGANTVEARNSSIEENKVGIIATDIPSDDLKVLANNNTEDVASGALELSKTLPNEPYNKYAEKYKTAESNAIASKNNSWKLSGNVSSAVGYHLVRTRHNRSSEDYILGSDTVHYGERYNNYFQTPGPFSAYNTYLTLQSPEGTTLEFSTEIRSNQWNYWNVRNLNLTYTDAYQKISLGDSYLSAGAIYLNGVDIFGLDYSLNLFQQPGERALFELSLFGGETNRPKLVGDKNPDVYKDRIEDGEGESQEILLGGKLTWNMHRRFNGALGFIGSKNYQDDPWFRDGMSMDRNTVDPNISSKTFFAEGNWLFWPGDIELNGQVALGAADTSDVWKQRAINQVFSKAGVMMSNFALLRNLMKNEALISSLRREELETIFGDNTMMTLSEMREQLKILIAEAKRVERKFASEEDDQQSVSDWDGQNFAVMAGLRWGIGSSVISAHVKYVGGKYYSAGSPDQLNNYREMGVSLDQRISRNWRFNLGYDLNIENASTENKYNVFGLSEGTTLGLFSDASSDWKKAHEQDDTRALYIHNGNIKNVLKFNNVEFTLKYKADYRQRNRGTRLYADYNATSGVFDDPWFKPQSSKAQTYDVVRENDTLHVDADRFLQYYDLSDREYLAAGFEEKLLKHIFDAELAFKFYKNTLKIGGVWIYRTDLSEFENDSLLDRFDFSNRTYGYLGYYFHGSDYFEQRYPISFASELPLFHNVLAFTPRYKMYNRDNMKEFEWTVSEAIDIPLVENFMDLSINAEARQEFIRRHKDGKSEMEADVNGSGTLRVHYTKKLTGDYTLGASYNYRPDSRSDEYKDFFGSMTVNYNF